jgi:CRISPR/Cas system CMR subunit Cmr6 (Cas7 group RAMP superfamily)
MALPLPRRQAELLDRSQNRSLWFDRGYAGYDSKWTPVKEGKTAFLRAFVTRFNDSHEYGPFLARREAAFAQQSATMVEATSSAPLLIGLGRWNPTELGFNFDRFTGSAFIPGSSVKGLLRAAARLVGAGEIEDPRANAAADYWKTHLHKIFGRGTGDAFIKDNADEAGSVCFYDAYPVKWSGIELDVFTPARTMRIGTIPCRFTFSAFRQRRRFTSGSAIGAIRSRQQTASVSSQRFSPSPWTGSASEGRGRRDTAGSPHRRRPKAGMARRRLP